MQVMAAAAWSSSVSIGLGDIEMGRYRSGSDSISFEQASAVSDAALQAYCIEMPLNRFLTIHLDKAELRPHHRRFVTQFLKCAGDWLRSRTGAKPCSVFAFENPPEGGLHVHILMHVPLEHWGDFVRASRRWLRRLLKRYRARYDCRVLRNSGVPSYPGFVRGTASTSDYLRDLRQILRYMLKGSEPRSAALLAMLAHTDFNPETDKLPQLLDAADLDLSSIEVSRQGFIRGKRCGYSELLGPSKRVFVRHRSHQNPEVVVPAREEEAQRLLALVGLIFTKSPTVMIGEPPLIDGSQSEFPEFVKTNARIASHPVAATRAARTSNGRQ